MARGNNRSRGSSRGSQRRRQAGARVPKTNLSFSEILIPEVIGGGNGLSVTHVNIMPTNFPWARQTAATFSKYQLRKVVLTFLPAGSMTYTGQVVAGFSYDAFENPPSSFAQVSQLARHRIQTVHRQQSWSLDVAQLGKSIYPVISPSSLESLADSEKIPYLPAIFHLCTSSPNTQTLGLVQITYSVDFSAPLFLEAGNGFSPFTISSPSEPPKQSED